MLNHSFDTVIATQYGIQAAILIAHFQYWITHNKRLEKNNIEGRTWTFQTLDEIAAHFPYMSKEEIRGTLHLLTEGKTRRSEKDDQSIEPVLLKGNFNKSAFNKTTWYAFIDENKYISNIPYEREGSHIERESSQFRSGRSPTSNKDTIQDTKPNVCMSVKEPDKNPPPDPKIPDSECLIRSTKGTMVRVVKDNLYKEAVRKKLDWSPEEICEAWDILKSSDSQIKDVFEFFGGIIQNLRIKKKNQEITNKQAKNPCKTEPLKKSEQKLFQNESGVIKKKSSGKGLGEQAYQELIVPLKTAYLKSYNG